MAGVVTLDVRAVAVAPGQDAVVTVRIRNVSRVVDAFWIDVLGDPAAWTTVALSEVRLFPDTDGTVPVSFHPPADAVPVAGAHAFAIRIRSSEDPHWVVIEEGTVQVLPVTNLTVAIRPRTSSGRGKGKHEVTVDNDGNTTVWVEVVGDDPDDILDFRSEPSNVELPPRTAAVVDFRARMVRRPPPGTGRIPFVVSVLADGKPAATADAGFTPRKFPWRPIVAAALVLVALIVALVVFTRDDDVVSIADQVETTQAGDTTTVPGETTTTGGEETTTIDEQGGAAAGRLDEPQIVFASERDGDFDLLLANADGSDAVALTRNDEFDGDPTFSSDGRRVVYVRGDIDGNTDLFLLDLEACNPDDLDTCEPERLTDTDEPESAPDFAPDGDTIVFSRDVAFDPDEPDGPTNHDLFLLDLDDGDEERLTDRDGDDARPQFSPDGSRIAFEQTIGGGVEVAVFDLDAGGFGPLANITTDQNPLWVDDETLVFTRAAGAETFEVVLHDLEVGAGGEQVLFDEIELELGAVSRDGSRLVYTSGTDLFVSDLDGDNDEQLTDDGDNRDGDLFEPDD
ncbi:MAG: hypothetical protein ACRD29_17820 [Acidimicrobiales bacterium]